MTESRVLLAAGAAAGALYLAGAIALGTPPAATDSGSEVVSWLTDNTDGVRVYAWTATFLAVAVAVIASLVRKLLPEVHGRIFMLGATALVIETALQAWFLGGLALHPESLEPATARTVLDVAIFWGPLLTGATMLMIGAVTALGFGGRDLIPGWLKVLGVVVFLQQAIETITVFGTDGFIEPGGDMNVLFGAGMTLVWLVGLILWASRELNSSTRGSGLGPLGSAS